MVDNINQKSKSEEDFEGIGFAECFSNLLNVVALIIIVIIMYLLFNNPYSKNVEKSEITKEINIQFVPTGNTKIDTEQFGSLINSKLKEYKEQLKDSEKERNESMKYYATLVSFILAIVGFFGFKSMHDTRQAAIEKAVFDAKKEATSIAKNVAEDKAEEIATIQSREVAIDVSKIEVERYLTDNKGDIFRLLENPIKDSYDPIILDYKERLDKLERPGLYNKEIYDFNDKLSSAYSELSERVNKLEKELIEKEVELLKLKLKA